MISIVVPNHTCASCGAVYMEEVDVDRARALIMAHQPLDMLFRGMSAAGWGRVYNDLERSRDLKAPLRSALVCAKCYGPVRLTEQESEARKLAATIMVSETVKTWSPA